MSILPPASKHRLFVTRLARCKLAALVIVVAAGCMCAIPFAGVTVRADTGPALPVTPLHSIYPSHVKVKDELQVANDEMDCNWNADCSNGMPVFHRETQESLGRVSGWLQTGSYKKKSKRMSFLTWGSTYSTTSSSNSDGTAAGSEAAAADFASEATGGGFKPSNCPALPLPSTQVQCWTMRGDGTPGNAKVDRCWLMAWWSGTAEVEMGAYANTSYALVRKTFHEIAIQTMGATASSAPTPTPTATVPSPAARSFLKTSGGPVLRPPEMAAVRAALASARP